MTDTGGLRDEDRRILDRVQADGRVSIRELAEAVQLPETTARDRLHRLEREGWIQRYRTVINHKALGFPILAWVVVQAPEARFEAACLHLGRDPAVLAGHVLPTQPGALAVQVVAGSTQRLFSLLEKWRNEHGAQTQEIFLMDDLTPEPIALDELEREKYLLGTLKSAW